MGNARLATDKNFVELVEESKDRLVMVDFWAAWCGPCMQIAPTIEELAKEYQDKVVVAKLDVDANGITSAQFGVRSIPTILFFKNGTVVDRQIGAVPKSALVEKIEKHS